MPINKDKLVALKELADLETGTLHTDRFDYENSLYPKAQRYKVLSTRIVTCRKCPGLNIKRFTEGCPGWGDLNAKVFFIGQSLHEPGMLSGLPFIGGSGYSIDAALRLSGLLRKDCFFSNVVHCHPQNNRASTEQEIKNCLNYLIEELAIVRPKLIVALGNDAKAALKTMEQRGLKIPKAAKIFKCKHPASFMYGCPENRIDWIIKLSQQIDRVIDI